MFGFGGKRARDPAVGSYFVARRCFLFMLGGVYLVAFVSLASQIDGLIGSGGILPAGEFLDRVGSRLGDDKIFQVPTVYWLGVSDQVLAVSCYVGMGLAALVMLGAGLPVVLPALWILYLSLASVGGVFLSFQWDALLLEAGFLACFLAPFQWEPYPSRERAPIRVVVLLFHLLLFKLMFSSGVVKLSSGDPTWRDLSAMSYHYLTQPLPNPLAWHLDKLPSWMLKTTTVVTFLAELVVPLFIFAPRKLRHIAGIVMILLQIGIVLTGNYGFFNGLTIALCLLLFDDAFWPAWMRKGYSNQLALVLEGTRPNFATPVWYRLAVLPAAVFLAGLSLFHVVGSFRQPIPWPDPVHSTSRFVAPFRINNGYGLFSVMTTERPEILIEGSHDGRIWEPYTFRFKPGELRRAPPVVLGHMPRLDWQMWFAALGSARQAGWFQVLAYRLLHGEPAVLSMLEENPFERTPPRYLRARLFDYRFSTTTERKEHHQWWMREETGVYLAPVTLESFRRAGS